MTLSLIGLLFIGESNLSAQGPSTWFRPKKVGLNCTGAVKSLIENLKSGGKVSLTDYQGAFATLQGRARSRRSSPLSDQEFALLRMMEATVAIAPLSQLDPHLSYRGNTDWNPGQSLEKAQTEKAGLVNAIEMNKTRVQSRGQEINQEIERRDEALKKFILSYLSASSQFADEVTEETGLAAAAIEASLISEIELETDGVSLNNSEDSEGFAQLKGAELLFRINEIEFEIDMNSLGLDEERLYHQDLIAVWNTLTQINVIDSKLKLAADQVRVKESELERLESQIGRLEKHEARTREIIFERILESYGVLDLYLAKKSKSKTTPQAQASKSPSPEHKEKIEDARRAASRLSRLESSLSDQWLPVLHRLRGTNDFSKTDLGQDGLSLVKKAAVVLSDFPEKDRARHIEAWIANSATTAESFIKGGDSEKYFKTRNQLAKAPHVEYVVQLPSIQVDRDLLDLSGAKQKKAKDLKVKIANAIETKRDTRGSVVGHIISERDLRKSELEQAMSKAQIRKTDLMAFMPLYKSLLYTAEPKNEAEQKMSKDQLARRRLAQWIASGDPKLVPALEKKLSYLKSRYWTLDRRLVRGAGAPIALGARAVRETAALGVRGAAAFTTERNQRGRLRPRATTTVLGVVSLATIVGLHRANHEGIEWAPSINEQSQFLSDRWSDAGNFVSPYVDRGLDYAGQAWGAASSQLDRIPESAYRNPYYDFTNYGSDLAAMPYVSWPLENGVTPSWEFLAEQLQAGRPSLQEAWESAVIFLGDQTENGISWVEEVGPSREDSETVTGDGED